MAYPRTRRPEATFVEVSPPTSSWWTRSERVEVVVGERHVIRVPDGFDSDTLRDVTHQRSPQARRG